MDQDRLRGVPPSTITCVYSKHADGEICLGVTVKRREFDKAFYFQFWHTLVLIDIGSTHLGVDV